MSSTNRKKIFVITQAVDLDNSNLSFFHHWLEKLAMEADLVVIANFVGRHNLPPNIKVLSLGKESGKGSIARLFTLWKYAGKYLGECDGIFSHMCPEYVLAVCLCAKIRRKKILFWYTHKDVTFKLRLAEKCADKIFSASAESFRLPSKKLEITGHGIDTELFSPLPELPIKKLLTVGRITPSKDLETMVLTVKSLREDGFDISFDIVGVPYLTEDKEYLNALKDLVKNSGLDGVVRFLGAYSNNQIARVYREHGIFLHASKTGSLDKAVLEAMASGLYVVSSSEAFKFLPELYRVDANDALSLASKIREILETRPENKLREIVIRDHNINALIKKIVSYF